MNIPLVPLRDVVIFPGVVTPLFVGRESSINSLQKAMSDDKSVMLVAQREANTENTLRKATLILYSLNSENFQKHLKKSDLKLPIKLDRLKG